MVSPEGASLAQSRLSLRRRSWIAAGVLLAILIAGVVWLVHLLPAESWALVRRTGPSYLAVALLLSALDTLLYTVAVYVLVRASGCRATMGQAYLALTSSLSLNYITPVKFGIPLRIYLYRRVMQVPVGIGTALVALEAWLGMLVSAVVAGIGIALVFPEVGLAIPLALVALLLAGMVVVLFVRPSLVSPLLQRLPFARFTLRFVRFAETVQVGFRQVSGWRSGLVALLFVLNLAAAATRLYGTLFVLGEQIGWLDSLAALTLSITAGNLSMIPMGLGVRDVSLTWLLAQSGVPQEIALSTAVIQRFFSPGWPLLLGLISANILGVQEIRGTFAEGVPGEDAVHPCSPT